MKINEILKDSNYKLTQFSQIQIQNLENQVIEKESKGKITYKVVCLVRKKEVVLTPEEVVRQLYLMTLTEQYHYPLNRIIVEYPVQFGSDNSKRADIMILAKEKDIAYIIVELKKPKQKEGKEQLKSYCNGTGSPMGVWTNGDQIEYYHRKDPNIFEELDNIPTFHQTLKDIFNEKVTILELLQSDKLEKKTLKRTIEEFEDEVLANAGVDVFEEAFKLIFSKLFDEWKSGKDKDKIANFLESNPEISLQDMREYKKKFANSKIQPDKNEKEKGIEKFFENVYKNFRVLEFRNLGVEIDTKTQIEKLFDDAKNKWTGIFQKDDKIKLTDTHLQTCVSYLQDVKLFNSNLEVVDEAFEYLINKDAKGDKGQYFTPRYVIDMCVKMLNPQAHEYMIDTASGSCGFPVHTIFHVWQQLEPTKNHLFTTEEKTEAQKDYVRNKVFAIDFDEKAVRVGRTLNLIAGDGETNVLQMNSLDYERWEVDFNERKEWRKIYGKGFENLENLKTNAKEGFKMMDFDILMANPPFAGDIKDARLKNKYELAKKYETKESTVDGETVRTSKEKGWHEKVSRDILFIERNLNMLKAGGRMAVVLPQGRFNNSSDRQIREFIAEKCRILAVVGLHGNTFKPHTGTKTSVLLLQKWTPEMKAQCTPPSGNEGQKLPQQGGGGLDYPIFFATQQLSGKDNSGEKLFRTDDKGELLTDKFNHPVVYHDLFSTALSNGTSTDEGIAEAFIEFAKKEQLSFF